MTTTMVVEHKEGEPQVLLRRGFCTQICVPRDWSDKQALEFAEQEYPCSHSQGWQIRESRGNNRSRCVNFDSHCHIVLDASTEKEKLFK